MCDYCGCRNAGPTAELAAEHVRLQELSDRLYQAILAHDDFAETFVEFSTLLELHAAKEETGLFPTVQRLGVLDHQVERLIAEHEQLHRQLGSGPHGADVSAALRLLSQHIDDEEYDLFPHIIHALDPEDWEEIELAHRAVELVFGVDTAGAGPGPDHDHPHPHDD